MRNIFDQYSQAENRITHAFMTALNEDRKLLRLFLRELLDNIEVPVDARRLVVIEQQYPGEVQPSEDEGEERGVPDGWIFDEETGWCLLFEIKVLAKLTNRQIVKHRAIAKRLGFQTIRIVAITQRRETASFDEVSLLEWRQISAWLRRKAAESSWAARVAEYLEIVEAKLIEELRFTEGALTMFAGFPFGHDRPFSYLEGKRLLRLAMLDLVQRQDLRKKLGVNAKASGRGSITGTKGDTVWDYLALSELNKKESFTKHAHLTLGIKTQSVEATVTVPDKVNGRMRQNIKALGEDGFTILLSKIVENLQPLLRRQQFAIPMFRGIQRRYPSQRSPAHVDAEIDFDLRTIISAGGPQKVQARWLTAGYGSFVHKENSNYQIQVGVRFPYERCPQIGDTAALNLISEAWLACKPLVELG